jgi:hypothetical protein
MGHMVRSVTRRARVAAFGVALGLVGACGGEPEVVRLEVSPLDTAGPPSVSLRVVPPPALQDDPLPDGAFTVRQDDEVLPVEVHAIDPETVEVALVVDLAGETGVPRPMTDIRPTAASFLLALPAAVRFTLIDAGSPSQAPAADIATAISRIRAMEPPARSDLVAAVEAAAAAFTPEPGHSRNVVVLTTGGGRADPNSIDRLGRGLAARGVVVHVLGVQSTMTLTVLNDLATATGGSVTLTDTAVEVADAAADTIASVVDGYQVDFVPSSTGDTRVEVELRHADVTARAVLPLPLEIP